MMLKMFCVSFAMLFCCGLSAQFMVGGYYSSQEAALRQLPVDKIDFSTYDILYQAFLRFDENGFLKPDEKLEPKRLIQAARAAGKTKVMISCGGGLFKCFPRLCHSPESADRLAERIAGFVVEHDYDGVDLDWESEGSAENGYRCGLLIEALHRHLNGLEKKRLLSVTVMGGKWFLKHLRPEALALADWINLMAYDMNWRIAAYHAPLQQNASGIAPEVSIESSLDYLEQHLKVPRHKICVGLPFYGFIYENLKPGEIIAGSPKGRRTMLSWARLQERGRGFKRVYDPVTRGVKLYSEQSDVYILLDDPESISSKVQWIKAGKYRGVFVWAVNQDRLPDGSAPLTAALKKAVE